MANEGTVYAPMYLSNVITRSVTYYLCLYLIVVMVITCILFICGHKNTLPLFKYWIIDNY